MNNIAEEWRPIKGYEGLYEVSNLGRVKALNYYRIDNEHIMQISKNNNGYLHTALFRDNKREDKLVHRIVAEAFIPNPDNKPFVDHINTDKTDNRVENLRWVTHFENMNNPITRKKMGKPVIQLTRNGVPVRYFQSITEVPQHTGNIVSVCRGQRHLANGFRWLYFDDYERFY